jgi:hypothetical protein
MLVVVRHPVHDCWAMPKLTDPGNEIDRWWARSEAIFEATVRALEHDIPSTRRPTTWTEPTPSPRMLQLPEDWAALVTPETHSATMSTPAAASCRAIREACQPRVEGWRPAEPWPMVHVMERRVIWLFASVGGTVGSLVPAIWGASELSLSSLLLGAVGAAAGVAFGARYA